MRTGMAGYVAGHPPSGDVGCLSKFSEAAGEGGPTLATLTLEAAHKATKRAWHTSNGYPPVG
jgi:hypothetical protein